MTVSKLLLWLTSGGGLGLILSYGYKFYAAWNTHRGLERAMNTHDQVAEILDRVISETTADYAQIVSIHNGGGRIEATTPLYMSIVAEEVRPGKDRMRA
ncbi:MAG: hypothetical protein AAFY91_13035, partial [Bacteroidota bacterium]